MLKRLKTLVVAMAATLAMAGTANAAALIDFGTAGLLGGNITTTGGQIVGTAIPIDKFLYTGTPVGSGTGIQVYGSATSTTGGSFGSLDFNTNTGAISIRGCIPTLSIGDAACAAPVDLITGTITSFTNLANVGILINAGIVTAPSISAALGLPVGTPFDLFASFSTAAGFTNVPGGAFASSTDVRAAAVPEPATMVLLGTGLLAAFRARRRQA